MDTSTLLICYVCSLVVLALVLAKVTIADYILANVDDEDLTDRYYAIGFAVKAWLAWHADPIALAMVGPIVRLATLASATIDRGFALYAGIWYALAVERSYQYRVRQLVSATIYRVAARCNVSPMWTLYRLKTRALQFRYTATSDGISVATITPIVQSIISRFNRDNDGSASVGAPYRVASMIVRWTLESSAVARRVATATGLAVQGRMLAMQGSPDDGTIASADNAIRVLATVKTIQSAIVVPDSAIPRIKNSTDRKGSPADRYVDNLLALLDRYSVAFAEYGWSSATYSGALARNVGGHLDLSRQRSGAADARRVADAREATIARAMRKIGAHVDTIDDNVTTTIEWSGRTPIAIVLWYHPTVVEYTARQRNTRSHGRARNASGEIKDGARDCSGHRVDAWRGVKRWSYHGATYTGTSSQSRIMPLSIAVPVGYLGTCPICGASAVQTRTSKAKRCACGASLVSRYTSRPGRMRGQLTGRDKGAIDATWDGRWEACSNILRSAAESYADKHGISFAWVADVRGLNQALKAERGV
jgi:hypothetical protein